MTVPTKHEALPSNKAFGLLFSLIFIAVAVWLGVLAYIAASILFGILAIVVALITIIKPDNLAPLNRAWMAVAHILARFINPIIFSLIFFGMLSPIAFIARLMGRDMLRINRNKVRKWEPRRIRSFEGDHFDEQF